jgi:hypothetical protein
MYSKCQIFICKVYFSSVISKVRGCESYNHPWTHIYHGVKSHLALPPFVFLGHYVNKKKGMQK